MSKRVSQLEIFLAGFRDDSDNPANGYIVKFFTADQTYTTPKNAWTTKDKDATITSVTLDSNGRYPTGAYFAGGEVYDLRLYESDGTTTVRSYANVKVPETTTNIRTVTSASVTATIDDDLILCDTTSNAITVTLYPAANFISPVSIKNIGSNTVTIDGDGSELIDGDATVPVSPSAAKNLYSDGSAWYTVTTSAGINEVTATDGTVVLDGGTDGTDATFTGDVTGDLTGTASLATKHGVSAVAGLNVKIVNIGEWDMDASTDVNVAHGVTDYADIRNVDVVIRSDTGVGKNYMLGRESSSVGGFIAEINATNVKLTRVGGGTYDNANFDEVAGYNRGYIVIYYID